MLSSATPIRRSTIIISRFAAPLRSLSTESEPAPAHAPHAQHLPQQQQHPPGAGRPHALFHPAPRRAAAAAPALPPAFGQNQRLTVPDETRAVLERVVGSFAAPVRYAFAYGSGVFAQAGYAPGKRPMLDFVFAVSHPAHWHSINMQQHPHHYPFCARALGSDFVARVQDVRPGLWFNALVPMGDVVSVWGSVSLPHVAAHRLRGRRSSTA
jgi:translocator assembly and maintenance protein 41